MTHAACNATALAEYSVSELAGDLQKALETRYPLVRVRGEISGLKIAASGHAYFSLKDAHAALDSVCWRGAAARYKTALQEGAEVICTGKVTAYGARSKYQLVADSVELAGAGALMAMLEERKKKLLAEGLFDAARKRPLPYLPRSIGVITSPTGAVIRDIIHRVSDRFPMPVILWPTAVQGEKSQGDIVAAFDHIARLCRSEDAPFPLPDVIILARGGGSAEDLWSFNEEAVVRAVAHCPIPVISAVGHETDVTLADFAADKRAPTPTGAAEMATPVLRELIVHNDACQERLLAALSGRLSLALRRLTDAERRSGNVAGNMFANSVARTDAAFARLTAAPEMFYARKATAFDYVNARLASNLIDFTRHEERLENVGAAISRAARQHVKDRENRLAMIKRLADSCSHQSVLARGYAMVRQDGKIVSDKKKFDRFSPAEIVFRDGAASVGKVKRTRNSASKSPPTQGSLF